MNFLVKGWSYSHSEWIFCGIFSNYAASILKNFCPRNIAFYFTILCTFSLTRRQELIKLKWSPGSNVNMNLMGPTHSYCPFMIRCLRFMSFVIHKWRNLKSIYYYASKKKFLFARKGKSFSNFSDKKPLLTYNLFIEEKNSWRNEHLTSPSFFHGCHRNMYNRLSSLDFTWMFFKDADRYFGNFFSFLSVLFILYLRLHILKAIKKIPHHDDASKVFLPINTLMLIN